MATAGLIGVASIETTKRGGLERFGLPVFGLLGFIILGTNRLWLVRWLRQSNRE